jgi:hypothetical protein
MYGQPRMAACCEMSSVSQSVISTTLRFKAESRRPDAAASLLPPPCAEVEKFMSSQMEDGKDAQWSVNMYLHVKTCLDYLWRGLDASLVSEGNLGLGGGGGGAMRLQQGASTTSQDCIFGAGGVGAASRDPRPGSQLVNEGGYVNRIGIFKKLGLGIYYIRTIYG